MGRRRSLAAVLGFACSVAAYDGKQTRNPFDVQDVPNPDGDDVKAFADRVKLAGGANDPNAMPWAKPAVVAKRDSLDGDWNSRWNGNFVGQSWVTGSATVKSLGDRVYIFYKQGPTTYLIDTKREGRSRLIGRYMNQQNNSDSLPWVGVIVDDTRIDGEWPSGRWDLRRKIGP